MDFSAYKDIYVLAEQRNGHIEDVAFELIGEARRVADKVTHVPYNVVAVLLGHGMEDRANLLIRHGADRVLVVDEPELADYTTELYTDALCEVIEARKPDAMLIGATVIGRDLAPRVAARINTGLTADATKIEIDTSDGQTLLAVTRPAFGGSLFATILCKNTRPQMATIRPRVMEPLPADDTRKGEIELLKSCVSGKTAVVKRRETIKKQLPGRDITRSDIVVSGGRYMGPYFNLLQQAADALGGVVGSSRAAVDLGYAPKDIQVGQTGKTVRPRLYLACGISGAVQHVAGMEKSEIIIAINKDEGAPIFSVANVGIVGDALEILPLLTRELEEYHRKKAMAVAE